MRAMKRTPAPAQLHKENSSEMLTYRRQTLQQFQEQLDGQLSDEQSGIERMKTAGLLYEQTFQNKL
jgi:hypothetical protein